MTITQRFIIAFAIVVAILLALAFIGFLTGNWNEDESARPGYGLGYLSGAKAQVLRERVPLPVLPISKYEKRILEIDRAAVDQAYHDQILHLFQNWMKDEREQPLRAMVGARQARSAYERVMNAIEEREQRLGLEQSPAPR
jgi:hypothetical protein